MLVPLNTISQLFLAAADDRASGAESRVGGNEPVCLEPAAGGREMTHRGQHENEAIHLGRRARYHLASWNERIYQGLHGTA